VNQKCSTYIEGDQTVFEQNSARAACAAGRRVCLHIATTAFGNVWNTLRDKNMLNELWSKGEAKWEIWKIATNIIYVV
jgi:glucose-1-phosphate cytidylyltransferase